MELQKKNGLLLKRGTTPTLDPVAKFESCLGILWRRDGDPEYTRERPFWGEGKSAEELKVRPSMTSDPLACMAMVKGGVAVVLGCPKHLGHTLALHSCKCIMTHSRDLASMILAVDNVWIFTRLKTVISKVFGCGPVSKLHAEVAKKLQEVDPKLYAEVQCRYKAHSFSKVQEACGTRWGLWEVWVKEE